MRLNYEEKAAKCLNDQTNRNQMRALFFRLSNLFSITHHSPLVIQSNRFAFACYWTFAIRWFSSKILAISFAHLTSHLNDEAVYLLQHQYQYTQFRLNSVVMSFRLDTFTIEHYVINEWRQWLMRYRYIFVFMMKCMSKARHLTNQQVPISNQKKRE